MSTGSLVNDITTAPANRAAVDLKEVGQFAQWWADPSVVGLMGFALTTIATGASNSFGFGATATIALALAFGGTAQFIAGLIDMRKGSIFGGSAFMSYGAFWWAIALIDWFLPLTGFKVPDEAKLAFFGCWTLFTLTFCLAVFKVSKLHSLLFWLLLIAFILLDLVAAGNPQLKVAAGYEIMLTGVVAWYIATTIMVNAMYGKKVLPFA